MLHDYMRLRLSSGGGSPLLLPRETAEEWVGAVMSYNATGFGFSTKSRLTGSCKGFRELTRRATGIHVRIERHTRLLAWTEAGKGQYQRDGFDVRDVLSHEWS
jgi:hypothetical protein